MFKLKTFTLFFLSGFFLLASNSSAFAGTVTFTTFYPIPFGVYDELRVKRMAIGDTYYEPSSYCWPGGPCGSSNIDANADLVVEGRVGIATMTPSESLEILGGRLKVANTMVDANGINRSDNGTLTLGLTTTAAVASVPPFSAPEMIDSDNGSFLVNPAGTSVFNIIELGGVQRSTWPVEGWKLVSCTGADADDHCTPSCGAGWSLISDIPISSYDHWTHLGLCKQD